MPKKLTYEYVKEYIEKEGYELLSDRYKKSSSKLKIRCPKGHEYRVTWNSFQNGTRCSECAGLKKLTYEHVKEQVQSAGYSLLSSEYKNSKTPISVMCPNDHEYKVRLDGFKSGKRCQKCLYKSQKLTYEYVKKQFEREGYQLLSDKYKGNNIKLKVKCPENHITSICYNKFKHGIRCAICSKKKKSSKSEKRILEYTIKHYKGTVISNDRTVIVNPNTGHNLELDIYLPELNKAIEFNGIYWHSLPKVIEHDKIKKQQCLERHIDLLIIHEEMWINNKEKCLNNIKEFIG